MLTLRLVVKEIIASDSRSMMRCDFMTGESDYFFFFELIAYLIAAVA